MGSKPTQGVGVVSIIILHQFGYYKIGLSFVGRQKIEIGIHHHANSLQDVLFEAQRFGKRVEYQFRLFGKDLEKKVLFVAVVVIHQGLIAARIVGDVLRSRSAEPLLQENLFCRCQDTRFGLCRSIR